MAEWSIAAVLKTAVLRGTGGSNPSLSAGRTGQNQSKTRQTLQIQQFVGFFICILSVLKDRKKTSKDRVLSLNRYLFSKSPNR